ncbi:MAG: CarD family transcriptional regulator [Hyphomicrobiaceae bacterium]
MAHKKKQTKVQPAKTALRGAKKPAAAAPKASASNKMAKPKSAKPVAAPRPAAKSPAKPAAVNKVLSKPDAAAKLAKTPVAKAAAVNPARAKAAALVKPKAAAKVTKQVKPVEAENVAPAVAAKPAVTVAKVKPKTAAAPAAAVAKAPEARAVPAAATVAKKPGAAPAAAAAQKPVDKKPVGQRHGFKMNEFVVYPAHGVGRIVGIEEQEIAGISLELFVITFEKEKLTLRVPTGKLEAVGMRKLAEENIVRKAMETLKGRARVKRTMWSRRAQEYVAKINSGDLVSIAEVVRDLYRSEAQPEQSYSERQLYEDALDRMAREIAAVEKLDERGAVQRITEVLARSARGRRAAEATVAEAA